MVREVNNNPPFVIRVGGPDDESGALGAFERGGHGTGLDIQLARKAGWVMRATPVDQVDHAELRKAQPKGAKRFGQGAIDRAGCCVQRVNHTQVWKIGHPEALVMGRGLYQINTAQNATRLPILAQYVACRG